MVLLADRTEKCKKIYGLEIRFPFTYYTMSLRKGEG